MLSNIIKNTTSLSSHLAQTKTICGRKIQLIRQRRYKSNRSSNHQSALNAIEKVANDIKFLGPQHKGEMRFPGQDIYLGENITSTFLEAYKNVKAQKTLIVTDKGLVSAGVLSSFMEDLNNGGIDFVVNSDSTPNPTVGDTIKIATAFIENGCDCVMGIGGGGPLDATKAAMGLVAMKRCDSSFDIDSQGSEFVATTLPSLLSSGNLPEGFEDNLPHISAIPTTAGTGSEAGKSAVITKPDGSKAVFGHPMLLPKIVALIPQLTTTLPKPLTAATGVDALFHLMEAYFVPYEDGVAEGMSPEDIEICEEYALQGIKIVLEWLPQAYERPTHLKSRLLMLLASSYGAKAFRKGSLGGVHACAHALGAFYHQHHGTCIARMAVPVLKHNEDSGVVPEKFQKVFKLFKDANIEGSTVSECTRTFLDSFSLPHGLEGLDVSDEQLETLSLMASQDGCQTNPVPLGLPEYQSIFKALKN